MILAKIMNCIVINCHNELTNKYEQQQLCCVDCQQHLTEQDLIESLDEEVLDDIS